MKSLFKWNSITTKIETFIMVNEVKGTAVQMKFYYNKDWNFSKPLVKYNVLSSNEILLQQRLKLIQSQKYA